MGEAIRGNKAPPAAVPTGVCVRTEGAAGTGRDGCSCSSAATCEPEPELRTAASSGFANCAHSQYSRA